MHRKWRSACSDAGLDFSQRMQICTAGGMPAKARRLVVAGEHAWTHDSSVLRKTFPPGEREVPLTTPRGGCGTHTCTQARPGAGEAPAVPLGAALALAPGPPAFRAPAGTAGQRRHARPGCAAHARPRAPRARETGAERHGTHRRTARSRRTMTCGVMELRIDCPLRSPRRSRCVCPAGRGGAAGARGEAGARGARAHPSAPPSQCTGSARACGDPRRPRAPAACVDGRTRGQHRGARRGARGGTGCRAQCRSSTSRRRTSSARSSCASAIPPLASATPRLA